MLGFFLRRTYPLTSRLVTTLLIVLLLCSNQLALADWESFTSAPVRSADSKTIRGFVSIPEGNGPFPAIIIAHGCLGVEQNQFEWAQRLNAWGYVTVVIDSFSPRKVKSVCSDPELVSAETRAFDVFGAAAYLRNQAFVNPQKIGLIGFSHGGWTVLCAAQKKFPANAQEEPLQAAVAYYPWCPRFGLKETSTPLLVLMGKEDNWTPLDRCERLLAEQGEEFENYVRLIAYNNAHHGFDDFSKKPGTEFEGHTIAFDRESAANSILDTRAFFDLHLE